MHTDNNTEQQCLFWVQSLSALVSWEYAFLARDWENYFFVKNCDGSYIIKKIETLDDSCIADKMREDYDSHEAWVEAVQDWETDRSYDDWASDIDIWNERDSSDYYDCPSAVVQILYNLWLWWDEEYAEDNWYYLDEAQTWTITADVLDNLYRRFDISSQYFNKNLWTDLEKKYWVNQIEFLAAEPIR